MSRLSRACCSKVHRGCGARNVLTSHDFLRALQACRPGSPGYLDLFGFIAAGASHMCVSRHLP